MNRDLGALLRDALTCSVFVSPSDPGLSDAELYEVGRLAGFQDGEIGDTFPHVPMEFRLPHRNMPQPHMLQVFDIHERADPPLLNEPAADFVYGALNERIRADGIRHARLDRGVAVERAVSAGHDRSTVESTIALLLAGEQVLLDGSNLAPKPSTFGGMLTLFGTQPRRRSSHTNKSRPRVLGFVREVVARRVDGRPRQAEPLDAFGEALERMGLRHFRAWWRQTVTEMRCSDPASAPVACTVLSAALVEGALTFAAKHARDGQLGAFQSPAYEGEPRTWKAERLIESAGMGGAGAILTPALKARAEHLNRMRQRVHAGRMLGEYPGGPPDLRPEEGRDAKATAEQVVRAVVDWLERASPAQA